VRSVEPLVIRAGVVIPADAMTMQASRSGGPGGQNVNKVASKVELRTDLARVPGLDAAASARLRALAAGKLDAEGRLLVVSQRSRDQHANLEDAREKVRALVLAALVEPRRRRRTRPTRGSVERRLAEKKRHGSQKATRRGGED
jgi:ribosome-associated protein